MDDNQTLIVEVVGPEDKIQKLLEKWEEEVEGSDDLEIKAVTIRRD